MARLSRATCAHRPIWTRTRCSIREFLTIGAVVHTHSDYATSFTQAGLPILAFGTTHADYFYGPVPVTAPLSDEVIQGRYVHETGLPL